MTVQKRILDALSAFDLPMQEDFFGGGETEYITFNLALDTASMHADDAPIHDTAHIQIHWFLPAEKNYLADKKKIRKALYNNGFSWPETAVLMEPDNKTRHVVFTCDVENDDELED